MQLFRTKIISISQKIAQKNRTFQSDESDQSDKSDFPDKALEKSKNHRFCPIFSDLRRIFISLTVVDEFFLFLRWWRFSGKLVGIDYALLPNREWNQKQKT